MSDEATTNTGNDTTDQGTTDNTRTMVLISLEQRTDLQEYLAKQPYQDVAGGVEFLRNALPINVNFTTDDSTSEDEQAT